MTTNHDRDFKYADIIHLPHHVSKHHVPMSMKDRAAQFSPFAALIGHDAAIAEAARLTTERPILDEAQKWEISDLLQRAAGDHRIALNIVYFIPDSRKTGGACAEACGSIKKLLPHERRLLLDDGTSIKMDDILGAEIV